MRQSCFNFRLFSDWEGIRPSVEKTESGRLRLFEAVDHKEIEMSGPENQRTSIQTRARSGLRKSPVTQPQKVSRPRHSLKKTLASDAHRSRPVDAAVTTQATGTAPVSSLISPEEMRQLITVEAYRRFLARDHEDGSAESDWFAAEATIQLLLEEEYQRASR
jgi:hypothetical protein